MLKEALRAHTAGTAKEKQIFIFGHCRLTVLTPRLIRVEHCPDGAFEDRASTAVWFRAFDVPPCKATLHRGTITLTTGDHPHRPCPHRHTADGNFFKRQNGGLPELRQPARHLPHPGRYLWAGTFAGRPGIPGRGEPLRRQSQLFAGCERPFLPPQEKGQRCVCVCLRPRLPGGDTGFL